MICDMIIIKRSFFLNFFNSTDCDSNTSNNDSDSFLWFPNSYRLFKPNKILNNNNNNLDRHKQILKLHNI